MTIKLDHTKKGSHIHVTVWVGSEGAMARSGSLVFREDEWEEFWAHFPELHPPKCTCEPWFTAHATGCPLHEETT